jgi:hypothetical protein
VPCVSPVKGEGHHRRAAGEYVAGSPDRREGEAGVNGCAEERFVGVDIS